MNSPIHATSTNINKLCDKVIENLAAFYQTKRKNVSVVCHGSTWNAIVIMPNEKIMLPITFISSGIDVPFKSPNLKSMWIDPKYLTL